jgi:hypothetical protein
MANTATERGSIPILFPGSDCSKVHCIVVAIDTAGADLTIFTPTDSKHYVGVVGIEYADTTAHNLTIKSGSTTISQVELATGGMLKEIHRGLLFVANKGEALIFNSSGAITAIGLYVVEFTYWMCE